MQKTIERLTREQMIKKYPNQWLGITNEKYINDDGITLESAEVVYTDKSRSELISMQVNGSGIIAWCTNEEGGMPLGLVGIE